jgi:hypothetical protein
MKTFFADILRMLVFAEVRAILTLAFLVIASPVWYGGILLVEETENMWLGLSLFGLSLGYLVISWHFADGTARRMCFQKLSFRLSLSQTISRWLGIWSAAKATKHQRSP